MDPHVADVEAILEAVAPRSTRTTQRRKRRPGATHALWLCACDTLDDAPLWLIYDSDDEGLVWCRVPDGAEITGLVDSRRIAGAHTSPGEVLQWLDGEVASPDDWGDPVVIEELGRKIRGS